MGTRARVVIAAPLPRLPLTAVAPARTRAPNTALVLAAIIPDARSVESTSPASIRRRSSGRSRGRSIDRSLAPSRHRFTDATRREGGPRRDDRRGVAITGPDSSRCLHVTTRLIFIPTGTTYTCGTHPPHTTSSPSLSDVRSRRADPAPIARVSRRLGRFFAGTVAHGGAREDDGRRRRRRRRETGDARRETRDARRETRAETTSVSTPTREAVGRGERTASVRFFHARVGAREDSPPVITRRG